MHLARSEEFAVNSTEHQITDGSAVFTVGGGTVRAPSFYYSGSGSALPLRYGQIIALAGDYYNNFDALNDAAQTEILSVLNSSVYLQNKDFDASFFANALPRSVSYYLYARANPEHFRGPPTPDTSPSGSYSIQSPYPYLSQLADDSLVAYAEGHKAAITHAIAHRGTDSEERRAYAIAAFYDHFLTDMFSAGHMRVPRRLLSGVFIPALNRLSTEVLQTLLPSTSAINAVPIIIDFLASKQMHDEDGMDNGLYVTNPRGDEPWFAYGDGRQSDGRNANNWTKCLDAVRLSVADVKEAVETGSDRNPPDFQALPLRPEPFPPGAEVHTDSRLSDYNTAMQPLNRNDDVECIVIDYPSRTNALIVPGHLVDRFARRENKLFVLRVKATYARVHLQKPVYSFNTTPAKSFTGGTLGVQAYPLYAIASQRLFVRLGPSGTSGTDHCNVYCTAEHNLNDPQAYDRGGLSSAPPQMTIRLSGRHQGRPIPS